MMWGVAAILVGLLGAIELASADYLEVRRVANIYAEPSRYAEVLEVVGPSEETPLMIVYLDDVKPRDGNYLRVIAPTIGEIGYIYKTAGRVYHDHDGQYEPYARSAYRHWIDEDRNCLDTRQEVLLRDAKDGIAQTKRVGSRCIVTDATWDDPYTGTEISDARSIDVDHLVPLKNAHESGGWAWTPERKRAYANFLGEAHHLLAVTASENRRKSDKGPDAYLPPNEPYRCEYVTEFTMTKLAWGLRVMPTERETTDAILAECPMP